MPPFRTVRRKMQKRAKRRKYRNCLACGKWWNVTHLWTDCRSGRLVIRTKCQNCDSVAELADAYPPE